MKLIGVCHYLSNPIYGEIKGVLKKIDYLQHNIHDLSPNELNSELEVLRNELIKIFNTISPDERQLLVSEIPDTLVGSRLLHSLPIAPDLRSNRYAINEAERRRLDEYIEPKEHLPKP